MQLECGNLTLLICLIKFVTQKKTNKNFAFCDILKITQYLKRILPGRKENAEFALYVALKMIHEKKSKHKSCVLRHFKNNSLFKYTSFFKN